MRRALDRGYVHVYCGNGKGKTSAALGLALRALGHDFRVCLIQFLKDDQTLGEVRALKRFATLHLRQFGRKGFVAPRRPRASDRNLASSAVLYAHEAMRSELHDILILDEINTAYDLKLVRWKDLQALVAEKPPWMELVLTGRTRSRRVLSLGDLVTEMREVRHYFRKGVKARTGIER